MADAPKGLLDKIRVGLFQGVTPEEIATARFMRESVMKPTTDREYAASVVAGMPSMEDVAMGFLQGGPGSLSGLFAGAVKPKGGMWHPEAVERLSSPLKDKLVAGNEAARFTMNNPVGVKLPQDTWADRAVRNYLNKYAGTADDPLKDIQIPFGQGTKRWEDVTDAIVTSTEAGRYKNREPLPDGMSYRGSTPSFPNVPPKEPIWRVESSAAVAPYEERKLSEVYLRQYLSHVGDYLKQNVASEKLQQYDLVRAVRETSLNDARVAAQMQKAARQATAQMPVYKEYPGGFKWIEMKVPEKLTPEQAKEIKTIADTPQNRQMIERGELPGEYYTNVMNNYTKQVARGRTPEEAWLSSRLAEEGNSMGHCVGGYCGDVAKGRSKIYSLRDAKGESHATIEVVPGSRLAGLQDALAPAGRRITLNTPGAPADMIAQIKGKQNRAPNPEYLPYVQDFVKEGKWGEVGDIQNAGMVSIKGQYLTREEARQLYPDIDKHIPYFPR